jgi:hypothetical protein
MTSPGPDPRNNAPRAVVAALIGAEAGAAIGLLFLGSIPLAPLGLAAAGAGAGFVCVAGLGEARRRLVLRGIRQQLRRGRSAPGAG